MLYWLHATSDFDIFIFNSSNRTIDSSTLHKKIQRYEKGIVKYRVENVEFIALEILEHLEYHAIYFDKFILVADDRAYIPFLKLLDNNDRARLVRRGNYETTMIGEGLEKLQWQDICYIVGSAMGLQFHEL